MRCDRSVPLSRQDTLASCYSPSSQQSIDHLLGYGSMIPDVTSAPSNEAGATVVQFNYCVSDHHFSSGRVEVSGLSTTSPSMMVLRGLRRIASEIELVILRIPMAMARLATP